MFNDKWRGYDPVSNKYDITQIESNNWANFKALHTMIHQMKLWIRTIYSCVSDYHIQGYFDEFCYRINRSQYKDTRFDKLINRNLKAEITDLVSN